MLQARQEQYRRQASQLQHAKVLMRTLKAQLRGLPAAAAAGGGGDDGEAEPEEAPPPPHWLALEEECRARMADAERLTAEARQESLALEEELKRLKGETTDDAPSDGVDGDASIPPGDAEGAEEGGDAAIDVDDSWRSVEDGASAEALQAAVQKAKVALDALARQTEAAGKAQGEKEAVLRARRQVQKSADAANDGLGARLGAANAAVAVLEEQLHGLQRAEEAYDGRMGEAQEAVMAREQQSDAQRERMGELSHAVSTLRDRVMGLEAQVEDVAADAEDEIRQLEATTIQEETRIRQSLTQALEEKARGGADRKRRMEATRVELHARVQAARRATSGKNGVLEAERAELEAKLARVADETGQGRSLMQDAVTPLQDQIRNLEARIEARELTDKSKEDSLMRSVDAMRAKLAEVGEVAKDAVRTAGELETAVAVDTAALGELEAANAEASARVAALRARIDTVEQETVAAQVRTSTATDAARRRIREADAETAKHSEVHRRLEDRRLMLESELRQLQRSRAALQAMREKRDTEDGESAAESTPPTTPTMEKLDAPGSPTLALATPASSHVLLRGTLEAEPGGEGEDLVGVYKRQLVEFDRMEEEVQRAEEERDALAEQLVQMTTAVEVGEPAAARLTMVHKEVEELRKRQEYSLELLGERQEAVEELRADLSDVRAMFKDQTQELADQLNAINK